MKNLTILVAIAALIFALYEFYLFETVGGMQGGQSHLWMSIVGFVVALIFGIIFFAGRVNKEEEIHITQ
jgi:uncharacterized membrane protein